MLKISFTGDVSLDKPLLKAAQKENGDFGFDEVFADIKDIFDSSDYVVGNLETVFAGSSKGYNVKPFGYNSPDEFLVALKKIGFDAFSMANNHCLDEGIDGLTRTVQVCKKNNIDISGVKVADVDNKIVFTLSGVKVCLLSYAHTINRSRNTDKIKNISEYVNLLYPYNAVKAQGIKSKFIHMLPLQLRESIKRKLGIPTVTKVIDHIFPEMINHNYIKRLVEDIQLAKKNADIVIMCVHCGGQFNDFPGEYSEYIFNVMKDAGADVIIGNHPHIIQRVDVDDTCVKAYSLGGFSLSPSAEYVHPEAKAEYSMILHVYIDTDTKEIAILTFVFVHSRDDIWIYTLLLSLGTFSSVLILWPFIIKKVRFYKPSIKGILSHIRPNLMLFLPVISVSLYNLMDKLILGYMSTTSEVQFYQYAETIVQIPCTLILALDTVMMPRVSNMLVKGMEEKISTLTEKVMTFAMFMGAASAFGLAAIADTFAPWFYGEEFTRTGLFIILLCPIVIFKSWAGVVRTLHIIPYRKDKIYLQSITIGAILNLFADFMLIPILSGIGAIIGTILAEGAVCYVQFFSVRKCLPFKRYIKRGILFCLAGVVMYLTIFNFKNLSTSSLMILMLQIILGAAIYSLVCFLIMRFILKDYQLINEIMSILRIKKRFGHKHY